MIDVLVIISVLVLWAAFSYRSELRRWNNGKSPTGKPWKFFDRDSQGGRGYCDEDGNYCWISWPGIEGDRP